MFEIAGSHIAQLNDTDLRTLVARLCEAELKHNGFSASAVTAGGDQNAPDGGLDVRVDLPPSTLISGFIPCPKTGFQVKVPDMTGTAIHKEMRPHGILRSVICDLASDSGAYIIVSSKGSVSDSALRRRRTAMRETVADVDEAKSMALDFYDRERLASWVRSYPGLITWVREKIGQPIQGWRPYGSWAAPSENLDAAFLIDEKCRLHDWRSLQDGPVGVEAGIDHMRDVLVQPKGCVRLVGLSGTGKTRLAQALFDDQVGKQALDPSIAVYTDLADQPDPSPRELLHHLIQSGQRAVVVVDNCPPDSHRALVQICSVPASQLSLLTIEYDVADDEPEGTEVFRLEPASDQLIGRLLEKRASHLPLVSRNRIAEFSGGNARIALAMAHTVRRGQSLSRLSDRELFDRLFHQRRSQDPSLLEAAEVCSLVYSFDGETLEGDKAELPVLAVLAGITVDQLYGRVAELRRRDLIQHRGRWRAVLPHALSNKLGSQALERILPDRVASIFWEGAPERLLRSFARRLGYLHDSEQAKRIVAGWLSEGGSLADVLALDGLGRSVLENIAPVMPGAVLKALEAAAACENATDFFGVSQPGRDVWVSLLRLIAYEPELFHRAAMLLARFVVAEESDKAGGAARERFKSLFQLYLSGTHASIDQRLQVVNSLIASHSESDQRCAIEALDVLLKTGPFNSSFRFEFGARPRDYGYHPSTYEEIASWYRPAVRCLQQVARSTGPFSGRARSILADHFGALWTRVGLFEELETIAREFSEEGSWTEGWIAVCNTIRSKSKDLLPEEVARLRVVEEVLRPTDLLQIARAYITSKAWEPLGIESPENCEDIEQKVEQKVKGSRRADERTKEIALDVAKRPEVLDQLLTDLFSVGAGRGWSFGRGLAAGAESLTDMWERLVEAFGKSSECERNNIQAIRGFLNKAAELDPQTVGVLLDGALQHPILAPLFVLLQTSIDIDERAAQRLEEALDLGWTPAWTYKELTIGRATDRIPPTILRRLILKMAALPDGLQVAVDVFAMRLYLARTDGRPIDHALVEIGREILSGYNFSRRDYEVDFDLGEIFLACFQGVEAFEPARSFIRRLCTALLDHQVYPSSFSHLLSCVFRTQPMVALDEFLGNRAKVERRRLARGFHLATRNPMDDVPDEQLIQWTQLNPQDRFPLLALAISPVTMGSDPPQLVWTPAAMAILKSAPDRTSVLRAFAQNFQPTSWSGSLATILESRCALVQQLFDDPDPSVAAWAREQDAQLNRWIQEERQNERRADERFE